MNQPIRHPLRAEQLHQPVRGARFTAAEFVGMAEKGAFDDMNVELLGGRLERMNPPMTGHSRVQGDLFFELRSIVPTIDRAVAFVDVGIAVAEDTVVGGDIVLARPMSDENRLLQPSEVLLVVEIAVSTLSRDTGPKRIAYAAAGIPHYWVVDPERKVTHVYGEPVSGDYADISTVRFGAALAVPGSERAITLG